MVNSSYNGLRKDGGEVLFSVARGQLDQIFETTAKIHPTRIAVASGNEKATYEEIDSRADSLARLLVSQGVEPNALVGLYVERGIDLIVGMIGILKAGGGYVPIDANTPELRVDWMLRDCGTKVAVTTSALADRIADRSITRVLTDRAASETRPESADRAPAPSARRERSDLAYMIYTSGSTGIPKGVLVEHRHVIRLFESTHQWFGFGPSDVWTMFHSVAFDFSVWEIWGALLFGGRLVIVPDQIRTSPPHFRELLRRERVTVLNQTPSAFRQLDAADRDAIDDRPGDLRLVIFGGERLDVGMLAGWMDRWGDERPALVNMYGITETTVHASFRPIHRADLARADRSPIGIPLPDLRFLVLNPAGEVSAVGEPGELHIGGEGVSRGYLNRADETAARFFAHPLAEGRQVYRTGDLVSADEAGQFYYLGRVDDQVKVRGFRIEPREIEIVLETHPEVSTSVVIPHDYGDGDVRLVAYLVANTPDAGPAWAEKVQMALADELAALPTYLRPSAFVSIPALPLTVNGKIDKSALPAPPARHVQVEIATFTPTQSKIAEIWADILNVTGVGLDDDFFDLGGTSLTLIRMLEQVNATLNGDIDITALVDEATVRSLASAVEPGLDVAPSMSGGKP